MNKVYVALRVRPEKLYELLQGSLPYRTFVRACDGFSLCCWQNLFIDGIVFIKVQCAKKVLSDSPGLVDFAIGLWILFLTCLMGKWSFFEEFKLQNCVINPAYQKVFRASWNEFWASKIYTSHSLPESCLSKSFWG